MADETSSNQDANSMTTTTVHNNINVNQAILNSNSSLTMGDVSMGSITPTATENAQLTSEELEAVEAFHQTFTKLLIIINFFLISKLLQSLQLEGIHVLIS